MSFSPVKKSTHYRVGFRMIQRSKGHSSLGRYSYQAGKKIIQYDANGKKIATHNHIDKNDEVVLSNVMMPSDAPARFSDPEIALNELERAENRRDAQLGRSFDISIPRELPEHLHAEFLEYQMSDFVSDKNLFCAYSIHKVPSLLEEGKLFSDLKLNQGEWFEQEHNVHGHMFLSIRPMEGDGWASKKDRDLNTFFKNTDLPTYFAEKQNEFFKKHGLDKSHGMHVEARTVKNHDGKLRQDGLTKADRAMLKRWLTMRENAIEAGREIPTMPLRLQSFFKKRDEVIIHNRNLEFAQGELLEIEKLIAQESDLNNVNIEDNDNDRTRATDATDRRLDRGADGGHLDGTDGIDGTDGSHRDGERAAQLGDSDDLVEQFDDRRNRLDENADDAGHRAADEHRQRRDGRDGRDANPEFDASDLDAVGADYIRVATDEFEYGSAAIEHDAITQISKANADKSAERSREIRAASERARERRQESPCDNNVNKQQGGSFVYRAFTSSLLKYSARREQRRAERVFNKMLIEMFIKAAAAALSFLFKILGNPVSVLNGTAFAEIPAAFSADIQQKQKRIDEVYQNKATDALLADIINQPVIYKQKLEDASIADKWQFYLDDKSKEVCRTKKWRAASSSAQEYEIQRRAYVRICNDVEKGTFSRDELREFFEQQQDMIFADEIIFDAYEDLKNDGISISPHDKPAGVSHRDYINEKYAEHHKPSQSYSDDLIDDYDDDDDYEPPTWGAP